MNPWQILGVEPTQDRRAIKRAYAKSLKQNNPEDDPGGFMRLREAYDLALSRSSQVRSEGALGEDQSILEASSADTEEDLPQSESDAYGDIDRAAAYDALIERVVPDPEIQPDVDDNAHNIATYDSLLEKVVSDPEVQAEVEDSADNSTTYDSLIEKIVLYSEIQPELEGSSAALRNEASRELFDLDAEQIRRRISTGFRQPYSSDEWRKLFQMPIFGNRRFRHEISGELLEEFAAHLNSKRSTMDFKSMQVIVSFISDSWLSDAVGTPFVREVALLGAITKNIRGCEVNREHFLNGLGSLLKYLAKLLFAPFGRVSQLTFSCYFFALVMVLFGIFYLKLPVFDLDTARLTKIDARISSLQQEIQAKDQLETTLPSAGSGTNGSQVEKGENAIQNGQNLNRLIIDHLRRERSELFERTVAQQVPGQYLFVFLAITFWSLWCVSLKRRHDRGESGTIFILAIPLAAGLLLDLLLGFSDEDNRFGKRPLYLLSSSSLRRALRSLINKHYAK